MHYEVWDCAEILPNEETHILTLISDLHHSPRRNRKEQHSTSENNIKKTTTSTSSYGERMLEVITDLLSHLNPTVFNQTTSVCCKTKKKKISPISMEKSSPPRHLKTRIRENSRIRYLKILWRS